MTPYEKAGRVIRLFAWIQVFAIVGIAVAIAIPLLVSGRAASAPPPRTELVIVATFVGFTIFQFILGSAVKEHKDWGRSVGIIYGILSLLGFPIGTLIGSYILWCLLKGWEEQPIAAQRFISGETGDGTASLEFHVRDKKVLKRKISSEPMIIPKIIFPLMWCCPFFILTLGQFLIDSSDKWVDSFFFIVGSGYLFTISYYSKTVEIEGDYLLVKNFWKVIKVPLSEVASINQSHITMTNPIWIHFKNKTKFGKKILFQPKGRFFGKKHPIIEELNKIIKEINSRPLPQNDIIGVGNKKSNYKV